MNKGNRFLSYIKAKGFYIALALCIVGASAAAWATAARTIESINNSNSKVISDISAGQREEQTQWNSASEQEVSKSTSGIEKSSSSSTPSSAPASSSSRSAGSAASVGSSGQQERPQTQPACVYTLPIPGGKVIGAYSDGKLVKNYTLNVWRTHDAIDVAAEKGAEVKTACAGTVSFAANDPLWGGVVRVDHADGHTTVYSGLKIAEKLKEGEKVADGQVIGTVDSIPSEISMEPHIHFAILKNGKAIDPSALIKLS